MAPAGAVGAAAAHGMDSVLDTAVIVLVSFHTTAPCTEEHRQTSTCTSEASSRMEGAPSTSA